MLKVAFGSPNPLFGSKRPALGSNALDSGAERGPEALSGAQTPPILGPLALSGVLPRRAHLRAPSLGGPSASLTMARPGVSGARGSRFLRRRQQLQQLELRRASAPPHSLPAARAAAAAAARPNGASTAAARAPPRPVRAPPHCGSHGSLRASLRTAGPADLSLPPRSGLGLWPAARARTRRGTTFRRRAPRPLCPLYFSPRRRGTARRRVTRSCVSRAAIGPGRRRK